MVKQEVVVIVLILQLYLILYDQYQSMSAHDENWDQTEKKKQSTSPSLSCVIRFLPHELHGYWCQQCRYNCYIPPNHEENRILLAEFLHRPCLDDLFPPHPRVKFRSGREKSNSLTITLPSISQKIN